MKLDKIAILLTVILLGIVVFSVISFKLEEASRINYYFEVTNWNDIDISKFELTYNQAIKIAQDEAAPKIIYSCSVYPTYEIRTQNHTDIGKYWIVQFFHGPPIPPIKVTIVVVDMSGEVVRVSEVTLVVGG